MQRRKFAKVVAGTIGTGALAGCTDDDSEETPTDDGEAADDVELELWHDKGQDPNWNPMFDEALPVLNDQLEGYQIDHVPYQATDAFQGAIRPVLGTEDGPAFFAWWAGSRLREVAEDNHAYDLTDVWESHIEEGRYSEETKKTFTVDGEAVGIPSQTNYWTMWYDTEAFDEWDVEPPSTWSDFEELCEDIQAASDTHPIAIPLGPEWTGFIWFQELVAGQSVEFYNELCQGEAAYTDDISTTALQKIGEMVEEGYFGPSDRAFSLGLDDLPRVLENREYGMTMIGDWFSGMMAAADVDFDKYDWFSLPPLDEGANDYMFVEPAPFVAHAGYPDETALEEVADAMLGTEFQQAWNEAQGFIPTNTEVDTDYLPESKVTLGEAAASGDYEIPLRYWENTVPDIAVPVSQGLQEIFQNPDSYDRILEQADREREQVYG